MQKVLLLIAVLFLSAACSKKTKNSLGLTETMPDEYQVKRNKSLEIPPHYKAIGSPKGDTATLSKAKVQKKNSLSKSEEALLKEVE